MYTDYQAGYLAHWLTLEGKAEETLTQAIASAKVDMNPHQVQAALFALESPLSQGVILADEVGLGKTIEASLVLSQNWAEHRRKLLLIVPATLRKQWSQELEEKFSLPSIILEARNFNQARKQGVGNPFDAETAFKAPAIIICSYEFAARKEQELGMVPWDLVVFDEAHKLRNIYKKSGAVTAKKLNSALQGCPKVLLSATPLQNNLEELYGLVSVVDPHFFGGLEAFKSRYCKAKLSDVELSLLRSRLAKVCHRTLRRQVQEEGGINFTRRYSMTEDFRPSGQELDFYRQFSSYLQDPETLAIKRGARHLVTLVIRKILASSSFAIQGTLENMITRLEEKASLSAALRDFDPYDDLVDETGESDAEFEVEAFKAEIDKLKDFKSLAASISTNAKADALVGVLDRAFDMAERLGGLRKAVVFTESVRTQQWLLELLSTEGYQDKIVLLNGSNSDPASKVIYEEWLKKHKCSSKVSGSKTADMKAALVDKFRDDATLMICTEAGAEGINLQFCSLLINYDLPWNPQRVEQRIGRVHRYGQKHDVVIVNFINKGNRADQKVFELLNRKFKLFEGVFGASDEILGSIESGVDVERRIHEIYQQCRSDEEIDKAFQRLNEEKSEQIEQRFQDTRRSLLERFDADVVKQLNMTREKTTEQLSKYQKRLLKFARMALPDADFDHEVSDHRFAYRGQCYDVHWETADETDAQFFRPHDGLGHQLIERHQLSMKQQSSIPEVEFTYQPQGEGQFSDLQPFIGMSGELVIDLLSFNMKNHRIEYLVAAGLTDTGQVLKPQTIDRLLLQPGHETGRVVSLAQTEILETSLLQEEQFYEERTNRYLEHYYEEETEKLERWAEDRRLALDIKTRQLDSEIKEMRKSIRQLPTLAEKRDGQRALKKLERERDSALLNYHEEKKKIELKEDRLLDDIDEKLKMTKSRQRLFAMKWTLTGGER
ncbi:SNF2-related protein [Endozoicomonas sp. 4G]|uniref:SNF2-related protein n=1 Tax=Endozoicomonas sp. 4G TaxID=2872754 RepID=UPI002078937D|nr:SNF2-related protein [Endozoicomonas sp. 4G]